MAVSGFVSVWAASTEFHIDQWQRKDGLPDANITAVAQTPDGFLWLGAPKGLVRFDGIHFALAAPINPSPTLTNSVTALCAVRTGSLWVGTETGDIIRMAVSGMGREARLIGSVGERVQTIVEDGNSTLWIETTNGLATSVATQEQGDRLTTNRQPDFPVYSLMVDSEGQLWGNNQDGVHIWHEGQWQRLAGQDDALHSSMLLCQTRAGRLLSIRGQWWISQEPDTGLKIFTTKAGAPDILWGAGPAIIGSPRFRPTQLLEDRSGHLWLGTAGSGVYYAPTNGVWHSLAPDNPLAFSGVGCLFEDHEGSIWIGTQGSGLFRARARLVHSAVLPLPERNHLIQSISPSRAGGVWVGTDGAGVFRYRDNKFESITTDTDFTTLYVSALREDRQTNLWIGSAGGVWKFKDGQIQEMNVSSRPIRNVKFLFEDNIGRLWVANKTRLSRKTGEHWADVKLNSPNESLNLRVIANGPEGSVWIGLINQGLWRLHAGGIDVVGIEQEPALAGTRALHFDRDAALWIGTANSGLLRYEQGRFAKWTTRDGLPSDKIWGIVEDADGVLWFSSDLGVFGCEKKQLNDYAAGRSPRVFCRQLSLTDGSGDATSSSVGQPIMVQSDDQTVWFGDMRALTSFQPRNIRPIPPLATVLVDEVRVDGKASRLSGQKIPASAKRIEFHYTSPQLTYPKSLFFRYRLEGMDRDWVGGGSERVASYSQLPAGHYQFRVMVGSSRGNWRESGTTFNLEVVPLWWQNVWFKTLVGAALLAGIIASVVLWERRRLRSKLERLRAQHALETERRRIARDLHDDLGARLTEIVLIGEIASGEEQAAAEVRQQVGGMTERIRNVVTALDEVVWTVNPKNDSLANLAEYLCDYLERFLAVTQISHRLDIQDDLPDLPIPAQLRHNVFLAVKEAINNAVKHAAATKIRLNIHTQNDWLTILIEDNGKGFNPDQLSKHAATRNGLGNMKSRMEALGGRLHIINSRNAGTTVKFELPLPPSPGQ